MRPLRFGIYAGIFWLLGSLLLVVLSALGGGAVSWSELDFRPLTALVLLGADALGHGPAFETVIRYAEHGIPITARLVSLALVTAGIDGFAAGVLTALVYNAVTAGRSPGTAGKALAFGVGLGAALGASSFLLSAVAIEYGFGITEFDFTIRPVWLTLTAFPGALPSVRESYLFFPGDYAGAAAWGAWGFVDGLVGGLAGAYAVLKIRGYFK
ncbi:MAG TPA: hypothetical protein PKC29_14645 [Thermodesulfobacteriota bacterium]|nr:hypothetical protein [Thermodesulfobacteriota bacterium]